MKDRKTLGNFDLLAELGQGGAGVVYKARHRVTEEIVAIKVLLPEQSGNRLAFKRFEQEFRSASPIKHPNLVRALDFQEVDGIKFLVMEYVEGRSMGERLEHAERIPVADAVAIIAQIGPALDWLHEHGVLHRDVKPDNIIVSPDGVAKLTDLGLAKEMLFDDHLTRTGSALGTPNFMAPEQFRDAKRVDSRADVYSLAATLYQMVTGVIPFHTNTPYDAWVKKAKNEFDPPRKLVPDIPESISRAIVRGMSGEPDQRPATCAEFIRSLFPPAPLSKNDKWELLFGDPHGTDSLSLNTEDVLRLLINNPTRVAGYVFARRAGSNGVFKPIEQLPEFRDTLSHPLFDTSDFHVVPDLTPTPISIPEPRSPERKSDVNPLLLFAVMALVAVIAYLLMRGQ